MTIHPIRTSRRLSRRHPNSRLPSGARWRRSTEVSSTRTGYAEHPGTTAPTDPTAVDALRMPTKIERIQRIS